MMERIFLMNATITSTGRKALTIIILTLAFAVATFFTAVLQSKEITLYFWTPQDEYQSITVTYGTEGIVEDTYQEMEGGLLFIHFRPLKPGTTSLTVKCIHKGASQSSDQFWDSLTVTSFSMVYSGRYSFQGMHAAFALIAVYFLCLSIFLFFWHRQSKKAFHFSYRTILDLGLSLYFFSQGLILIGAVIYSLFFRGEPLRGEHFFLITSFTLSIISLLAVPLLVIFSIVMIVSNVVLLRREGVRLTNSLGILISILLMSAILVLMLTVYRSSAIISLETTDTYIRVMRGILSCLFYYFICNLFSTLLYCQRAGKHHPEYNKDYLIILGCGIREDGTLFPLLQGRADRAIRFAREQLEETGKKVIFIPSGGQGPDECMPEGEAIRNYLLSQGIPGDQIMPETRSVNTAQNMLFSRDLIEDALADSDPDVPPEVAFSTTNFHVFRSGILAADTGMNADGMGAPTKWYFWPNALIREFIGLLAREWKLHLILLVVIVVSALISGNLEYFFKIFP